MCVCICVNVAWPAPVKGLRGRVEGSRRGEIRGSCSGRAALAAIRLCHVIVHGCRLQLRALFSRDVYIVCAPLPQCTCVCVCVSPCVSPAALFCFAFLCLRVHVSRSVCCVVLCCVALPCGGGSIPLRADSDCDVDGEESREGPLEDAAEDFKWFLLRKK